MRVFISQPMKGKTKEEIEAASASARTALERSGHTVKSGYIGDKALVSTNEALWYLGMSITTLAECDALLYTEEWKGVSSVPRGCRAEMKCAELYGIPVYKGEAGLAKLCLMGLKEHL